MPKELARAELLVSLCQFFHALPDEILRQDAEIMQLVKIYQLANPGKGGESG